MTIVVSCLYQNIYHNKSKFGIRVNIHRNESSLPLLPVIDMLVETTGSKDTLCMFCTCFNMKVEALKATTH